MGSFQTDEAGELQVLLKRRERRSDIWCRIAYAWTHRLLILFQKNSPVLQGWEWIKFIINISPSFSYSYIIDIFRYNKIFEKNILR